MSGTPKRGLDYSGWSTDIFDDETNNIDGLLSEYGWDGFGVYFYLCQRAFGVNGYYYEWGFENAASTARRVGCGVTAKTVREVVSACLELGLFDKAMFTNYKILTNHMIQERFMYAVDKRAPSGRTVDGRYWLLSPAQTKAHILFKEKAGAADNEKHSLPENSHSLPEDEHSLSENATKERKVKDRKAKDSKSTVGCAEPAAAAPPAADKNGFDFGLNAGVIENIGNSKIEEAVCENQQQFKDRATDKCDNKADYQGSDGETGGFCEKSGGFNAENGGFGGGTGGFNAENSGFGGKTGGFNADNSGFNAETGSFDTENGSFGGGTDGFDTENGGFGGGTGGFGENDDSTSAAASRNENPHAEQKLPITEKSLSEQYGKENVKDYLQRFENWKARKGLTARLNKWSVIAKWLEQDGVTKPAPSSFDPDSVLEMIKARYNSS